MLKKTEKENGSSGSTVDSGRGRGETLIAEICGIRLVYTLTSDVSAGVGFYTIIVEAFFPDGASEREVLCELTSERALAKTILRALRDGAVTPCAARGVADDILAETAKKRAFDRFFRFARGEEKASRSL